MNQINLSDRKAVVTGGARGIGLAIAKRLIQSGADVSLWDIDTEAAAQAKTNLGKYSEVKIQNVHLTDEDAVADAKKRPQSVSWGKLIYFATMLGSLVASTKHGNIPWRNFDV